MMSACNSAMTCLNLALHFLLESVCAEYVIKQSSGQLVIVVE